MSAPTSSLNEPTTAYPPRFWWLKRVSSLVLVTLLALGGLRWWWGRVARSRLDGAIAAARARHEPVLPEDFPTSHVPDDLNAAITLQRAAAALAIDANWKAMYRWNGRPFTPAELLRVEVIAENNRLPLRLVRRARSQPDADWGIASPWHNEFVSSRRLDHQISLSYLEEWVALRDHSQHNDAEAMEHVLDLLRQADAMDQGCAFYLPHQMSLATHRRAINILAHIVPDLRITTGEGTFPSRDGAATPAQIHELIARLLDEHHLRDGAIGMFDGTRVIAIQMVDDSLQCFDAPGRHTAAEAWLVRPMFLLDASRISTNCSLMRSAAAQPNWPAADAIFPPDMILWTDLDRYVHALSHDFFSVLRLRESMMQFPTMTDRRAAAIALAIGSYRMKHRGRLPAQLSELVPDDLPAVPIDPMAADGRPFGYHPDLHPPVIYSVGRNGVDDGGTSLPDDIIGNSRWEKADAVYPLGPLPPKKPRANGNSRRSRTSTAPSPG
jgi:hypothetical protein